jgi:dipeptidyl aminopeptidase/acylaminoacyl peptidase
MKNLILSVCMAVGLTQPAAMPPADNLVVEGVPNPPLSLVDSVNKYTEFRSAAVTSWHPKKKEMLINTRFADTKQMHHVQFPLGARTQLTFFKDSATSGSYQPTDGDYFVFSKDNGGDEFFQLYRYDFDTYAVTLLTDGKSRNTGGAWSNRGDRLAYGSTRRNGNDVDIYVINPKDPKSDRMVTELQGGGWEALDWSPDDKTILAVEEISANESYLWLIDTESGKKTLITPKEQKEQIYYGGGQFSKDGKKIYTTTDKDNEFKRLATIDTKTGRHEYLTDHIKWDVDEFAVCKDGAQLAFITNEDGLAALHLLDPSTRKEKALPKLPAGQVAGLVWHNDSHDLGFEIANAQSPPDVYSLDTRGGKVERWTKSETGGLQTKDFREPELVHWKSFDGKIISGFLYKPPARFTGKRPVVINIHGGPEGQSRPGFMGKLNYYLDEMGVAILFPNVRGSTGYGKTFLKMDNGFLRQDSYKDIDALFAYIKGRNDIDAERVMVTGGSYGGHMTLAISTFYSDKIRCSLDVVGPSNLVTFLKNTQGYRRDLRRVEYGDERDPKMAEFLEKIAPANNAQMIKKPLFVVQGKNDPRVPASESEQMVAAIRRTGTPVWFLMANDEGHGFAKKKNSDFQFYATIEFMQKFLLN